MRVSVRSVMAAARLKYKDLDSEEFSFLRLLTVNVIQCTLKALFKGGMPGVPVLGDALQYRSLLRYLLGLRTGLLQLLRLRRLGFGLGFRV